jgi:hypothetical protein
MGDQILNRHLLSPHTGQSAALTSAQLERLGEGSSQNLTHGGRSGGRDMSMKG